MKKEPYAAASVKAFIEHGGKILILRESSKYIGGSQQGNYVIPGGKVDAGEHFLDTLHREVKEECGLDIKVGQPFHTDEWRINVTGKPQYIVATFFRCKCLGGDVKLNGEFDSYKWIKPREYVKYNLNPAAKRSFKSYLKILPP